MSKEKKRDPIKVMLRWTVILAVVAVALLCWQQIDKLIHFFIEE